jgi:hypothetical protein
MKACGSGCIDPRFLDLGANWKQVASFTPRLLFPWKRAPRYPLDRRLGDRRAFQDEVEKGKFLIPPGLEP